MQAIRFTLQAHHWYAMQVTGDEFGAEPFHFSPIRVDRVTLAGSGQRRFEIAFHHANYPAGVQSKVHTLETVERSRHFQIARTPAGDTRRYVTFSAVTSRWLRLHFPHLRPADADVQGWLERNA